MCEGFATIPVLVGFVIAGEKEIIVVSNFKQLISFVKYK
jgi:hypothetical protein